MLLSGCTLFVIQIHDGKYGYCGLMLFGAVQFAIGALMALWERMKRQFVDWRMRWYSTITPFDQITDSEIKECAICMAEYTPKCSVCTMPCGHHYHYQCLREWIVSNTEKCVYCQQFMANAINLHSQPHPHDE